MKYFSGFRIFLVVALSVCCLVSSTLTNDANTIEFSHIDLIEGQYFTFTMTFETDLTRQNYPAIRPITPDGDGTSCQWAVLSLYDPAHVTQYNPFNPLSPLSTKIHDSSTCWNLNANDNSITAVATLDFGSTDVNPCQVLIIPLAPIVAGTSVTCAAYVHTASAVTTKPRLVDTAFEYVLGDHDTAIPFSTMTPNSKLIKIAPLSSSLPQKLSIAYHPNTSSGISAVGDYRDIDSISFNTTLAPHSIYAVHVTIGDATSAYNVDYGSNLDGLGSFLGMDARCGNTAGIRFVVPTETPPERQNSQRSLYLVTSQTFNPSAPVNCTIPIHLLPYFTRLAEESFFDQAQDFNTPIFINVSLYSAGTEMVTAVSADINTMVLYTPGTLIRSPKQGALHYLKSSHEINTVGALQTTVEFIAYINKKDLEFEYEFDKSQTAIGDIEKAEFICKQLSTKKSITIPFPLDVKKPEGKIPLGPSVVSGDVLRCKLTLTYPVGDAIITPFELELEYGSQSITHITAPSMDYVFPKITPIQPGDNQKHEVFSRLNNTFAEWKLLYKISESLSINKDISRPFNTEIEFPIHYILYDSPSHEVRIGDASAKCSYTKKLDRAGLDITATASQITIKRIELPYGANHSFSLLDRRHHTFSGSMKAGESIEITCYSPLRSSLKYAVYPPTSLDRIARGRDESRYFFWYASLLSVGYMTSSAARTVEISGLLDNSTPVDWNGVKHSEDGSLVEANPIVSLMVSMNKIITKDEEIAALVALFPTLLKQSAIPESPDDIDLVNLYSKIHSEKDFIISEYNNAIKTLVTYHPTPNAVDFAGPILPMIKKTIEDAYGRRPGPSHLVFSIPIENLVGSDLDTIFENVYRYRYNAITIDNINYSIAPAISDELWTPGIHGHPRFLTNNQIDKTGDAAFLIPLGSPCHSNLHCNTILFTPGEMNGVCYQNTCTELEATQKDRVLMAYNTLSRINSDEAMFNWVRLNPTNPDDYDNKANKILLGVIIAVVILAVIAVVVVIVVAVKKKKVAMKKRPEYTDLLSDEY